MKLNNLRNATTKEVKKSYSVTLETIKTDVGLAEKLSQYGKTYKGTTDQQRFKFTKYINLLMNKRIAEQMRKIDLVCNARPFNSTLNITVEWKRSQMWGSNPTAHTNFGFHGSSIGGCGYCKLSTATAQALNSHLPLLQLMYKIKNRNIGTNNHDILHYGSGYGILPHFEGGVGVESHISIIRKLGLKMRCITSTPNVDVYTVSKK